MAIQLKFDYSKKLGLPQYSSHQFSVSLTSEVNDVSHIHAEVERIYRVLQDAVDAQIVNPGFTPGAEVAEPVARPAGNAGEAPEQWACSPAQKGLILDLVVRHGLDKNEVEHLAQERFGCGVKQLNKLKASSLIDELMGRFGEAKPRFAGRASAPRRPSGYAERRAA